MSNIKCLFSSVCICLLSQAQFALCVLCLCETIVKTPTAHRTSLPLTFYSPCVFLYSALTSTTCATYLPLHTTDAHPHRNLFSQSLQSLDSCEKQVNLPADLMTWRCFTEFNLWPWRVHAFLNSWLLQEGKLLFVCILVFPPWKPRLLQLRVSIKWKLGAWIPRNLNWKFHQSYKCHFLLHSWHHPFKTQWHLSKKMLFLFSFFCFVQIDNQYLSGHSHLNSLKQMEMKQLFLIFLLPPFILILETSAVHMAYAILMHPHHCLDMDQACREKPRNFTQHSDPLRDFYYLKIILFVQLLGRIGVKLFHIVITGTCRWMLSNEQSGKIVLNTRTHDRDTM